MDVTRKTEIRFNSSGMIVKVSADPFSAFLVSGRSALAVRIRENLHADELADELVGAVDTVARWIDGDTDYAAMRRAMVFFEKHFPGKYAATAGRTVYRGQCVKRFDGAPRSYTYDKSVAEGFPASSYFDLFGGAAGRCLFIERRVCDRCADRAAFRLTLDLKKVLSDYTDNRFGDEKEVVILNTRPVGSTAKVYERENGRPRKPVHKISDRAKRYRANADGSRPGPPKQCGFCGSRRFVEVHHINGNESDGAPENLMWACKSCNAKVGNILRRARIGRRTVQFNRAKYTKKALMHEYGNAIKVMRGDFEGDVGAAMATIRATPADLRSAYTSRAWATRRAIYGPSGRSGDSDVPF